MKKYLLILLLVTTVKSFGQGHFVGFKGGLDASTIVANKNFYSTGFRMGVSGGLAYEHSSNAGFSFGADIRYDQRGFKSRERWSDVNGGYVMWYDSKGNMVGEWLVSEYRYNYLSLPIKAGYQFGRKLSFNISAGIIPSLLLNAKLSQPYSLYVTGANVVEWGESNIKGSTRSLNFAGFGEIEIAYNLKANLWLTSSLSYQHDLRVIDDVQYNSYYYYKYGIVLHGMTIDVGVKWALGNKSATE